MPEGLLEVREPQGRAGPAFSLRRLLPPCSRDLKRDVAKKLEKLEKRTPPHPTPAVFFPISLGPESTNLILQSCLGKVFASRELGA